MTERIDKITGEAQKGNNPWQPLLYVLVLIFGVYVGTNFSGDTVFTHSGSLGENPNKLVNVINKIDEMYVDSVEKKMLVEKAINSVFRGIRPAFLLHFS